MQIGTALVFLLMLGAALAFVGWPLATPQRAEDEPTARERRREDLVDKKERLLSALRDLDLDHRTGKTDDEDHAALSASLKSETAATMKEIDAVDRARPAREPVRPPPAPAAAPSAAAAPSVSASVSPSASTATRFCTQCGWKAKAANDRFCGRCGSELPVD